MPQGFIVDLKKLQILLRYCSLYFLSITYNLKHDCLPTQAPGGTVEYGQ